nr:hypothetical protein GCM10020185_29310 [Pseudomonas brassicacearum subsp. brassicacearum]
MIVHDEIDPVARTRTHWTDGGGKTCTFLNALEKPARVERMDLSGVVREVTVYDYDGLGRCIRQIASDGAVTRYTYDLAGRVLSTTLPDGTVIEKKSTRCKVRLITPRKSARTAMYWELVPTMG